MKGWLGSFASKRAIAEVRWARVRPRTRTASGLGGVAIADLALFAAAAFALLAVALPFTRYLALTLPFVVAIVVIADGDVRFGPEVRPFLWIILVGVILAPLGNKEGYRDLFLIFSGVCVALVAASFPLRLSAWVMGYVGAFVVYFALFGLRRGAAGFDVEGSSSPFESIFGFLFPLVALRCAMDRRWGYFALCLVLGILSMKRIAILSLIVCLAFVLIGQKRGNLVLNPLVLILVNFFVVATLVAYGVGSLDPLLFHLTGKSANELGQGRQYILSLPAHEILAHPFRFLLLGNGPGSTYELAFKGSGFLSSKVNLHSDLIKILYEYGALACVGLIYLMYSVKSYTLRILFLFINILFFTDNTLIYYSFLIPFIAMTRMPAIERSEKRVGVAA